MTVKHVIQAFNIPCFFRFFLTGQRNVKKILVRSISKFYKNMHNHTSQKIIISHTSVQTLIDIFSKMSTNFVDLTDQIMEVL